MEVNNKQTHTCSCGHVHTVSPREIKLTKPLVQAMIDVFRWSEEKGIHEFKRSEINHITTKTSTVNSNFGYLSWMTGIFYHPEGKRGSWGIHKDRMKEFLNGQRRVATLAVKDPISENIELSDYRSIRDVPEFVECLNENHEFVVNYIERNDFDPRQGSLL